MHENEFGFPILNPLIMGLPPWTQSVSYEQNELGSGDNQQPHPASAERRDRYFIFITSSLLALTR